MQVRALDAADLPQIAALWQYWFRDKTLQPDPYLIDLARRMYVERPNRDPEVPSLVAVDDAGRVTGFLGVTTTPVQVDGASRTLAGVFPSVIAPDAPAMVATILLRRHLAGSQALTISDGGHVKFERIWERLGGAIAPTASLRWVKVLRPVRWGASMTLEARSVGRAARPLWSPLVTVTDGLARRAKPSWFRPAVLPSDTEASSSDHEGSDRVTHGERLTAAGLIDGMESVHAATRLRPEYDPNYLTWLFAEMAAIPGQGRFTARRIVTAAGATAGWWIAYLRPGGTSRVFALDGEPRYLGAVIDHLFATADAAGVGALVGRLDPRLRRPMAERSALVVNGGSLQMIHASDPTLLSDALLGRLAFSRLEGENWFWWGIVPPAHGAPQGA